MAAQRPVLKSNVAHRWSCVVERRGGSLRSALSKCNLEQGLQTLRPLRHFTFRLSIRRSSHCSRRRRSTAATIRHQIINTSCPTSLPPLLPLYATLSYERAARAWRNIIYADFCETKASNLNCRKRCRQRAKRNKREN